MNTSTLNNPVGQINPSLSVEAELGAQVNEQLFTSKFDLQENPELAAWLIGFANFFLIKSGKLAGPQRIDPPPGGKIYAELLNGRVILSTPKAGGGHEHRLNPQLNIWLTVKVRLLNQPAKHESVAILDDPEVAKWLLSYFAGDEQHSDALPADPAVAGRLGEIGVIVNELPAPEIYFPDARLATHLNQSRAIADHLYPQPAGEAIPEAVLQVLGRHQPALPPDTDLLWLQDSGTGLMLPAIDAPDEQISDAESYALSVDQRKAEWDTQIRTARESLQTDHYTALRNIFAPAQREALRHYVRELYQRGYFPPLGIDQVNQRTGLHNQATFASIHHGLALLIGKIINEPVIASYSYLGCYEGGASLLRHKDREQCKFNLSLIFDMQGPDGEPEPWPIYLELDNGPVAVNLKVGDGVLYSGTDITHWRDALPADQRVIACFFHFVSEDFDGSLV